MNARHPMLRLVLLTAALFSFAADARPYTVTDQLQLETIGYNTAVDPGGRWIVWEQTPRYDQLPDYGIGRFCACEGTGARLMAVDLSAARPSAAPLFAADPLKSYWLEGFSPNGRYLLFYTATAGRIELGVYDLELRKVTTFNVAPAVPLMGRHRSAWIANDEFVFSALPEGDQPATISLRRHTGERLAQEWQKAWRGVEPTGSEVSSHVQDQDDAFLPGRLLRANASTGELRQMADGLYENLEPSHDGRFLAGLRQLRRVQPQPGVADVDWVLTRSQLYLFDLRQGGAGQRLVPDKDVFPVTLAWAEDSDRLAFFAWEKGAGARQGMFHALEANTGAIVPYAHTGLDLVPERERGFAEKPERALWIDGKLAVFAREQADRRAAPRFTYSTEDSFKTVRATPPHWFLLDAKGEALKLTGKLGSISPIPVNADAHSLTVLADGAVWRVSPGRAPRKLTARAPGKWNHPNPVRWSTAHDPFPASASFIEETADTLRVALLDQTNDVVSVVTSPGADAILMAGSAPRHTALFRQRKGAVTQLLLRDASGRQQQLAKINEHLASVTPGEWLQFKYTVQSHLGPRELESCALLPPDYQPGRRYPLIVDVYPGIRPRCGLASSRAIDDIGEHMRPWEPNILAARGYIVVQPTTPSELIRTAAGPIAGMTDVVLPAVDALVAQGYADADRVGLFGFSQGGFSSLWVATQTPRFKAVVSGNGWSDMYSDYFQSTIYHHFYTDLIPYIGDSVRYEVDGGDFGLGVSPYANPDRYLSNSPLFHAKQITTPLLMIHSDMDAINFMQYEMMFTALYLQRKEVKFLRYRGEGHGISSPANVRQSTASVLAWYDQWLDVTRAEDGNIVWAGERGASRQGASPRTVEWFIENDRRIALPITPSLTPPPHR
jgi:dipeptidyl aminopeptidase/acylaminoacyl peptidase